jgi:hypothetical protein
MGRLRSRPSYTRPSRSACATPARPVCTVLGACPRLHRPTTLAGSWSGAREACLPGGGAERGRAATGFGHGRSGAGRVAAASDRRCRPGHGRSAPLWRGRVAALARPGREWCGAWCQVETGLWCMGPSTERRRPTSGTPRQKYFWIKNTSETKLAQKIARSWEKF